MKGVPIRRCRVENKNRVEGESTRRIGAQYLRASDNCFSIKFSRFSFLFLQFLLLLSSSSRYYLYT